MRTFRIGDDERRVARGSPFHLVIRKQRRDQQVVREGGQVFLEDVQLPIGDAIPLQVLLYILRVLREA